MGLLVSPVPPELGSLKLGGLLVTIGELGGVSGDCGVDGVTWDACATDLGITPVANMDVIFV